MHARRSEEKAVIEEMSRHSGLDPESIIIKLWREAPQKYPFSPRGGGLGRGLEKFD
jgi:hypothetical protein